MTPMLRWLIAALLLSNAVYYYWQYERPQPTQTSPAIKGAQLVLLSELETPAVSKSITVQPGAVVSTADLAPIVLPAELRRLPQPVSASAPEPVQAPAIVARPPSGEPVALVVPAEGASTSLFDVARREREKQAALEQAAAEARAEAETLRQAEAEAERVAVAARKQAEQEAAAAAEEAAAMQCWLAGPIASPILKDVIERQYNASGLVMRLETRSVVADTKYWVYVDAGGDANARKKLRAELLQAGVDNYVIAAGALKGQLSLGLFRQLRSANEVLEKRLAQGFPVELYEVIDTRDEYWLQLNSRERKALQWPAESNTVPGRPDLVLDPVSCPQSTPLQESGVRHTAPESQVSPWLLTAQS